MYFDLSFVQNDNDHPDGVSYPLIKKQGTQGCIRLIDHVNPDADRLIAAKPEVFSL
jgi:hypothetical protein